VGINRKADESKKMEFKNIVLTGATSGIGQEMARELVKSNNRLWLIVRNQEKIKDLQTDLLMINPRGKLEFIVADLSSIQAALNAARIISEKADVVDVILNNAGAIYEQKIITDEGLETTMVTNFLSHYVITQHLIGKLAHSKDARIINIGSEMYRMNDWDDDLMFENKPYEMAKAYANTKLAFIFYTQWLADKYKEKNIKANCIHPGVVDTGFAANNEGWIKYGMNIIRPFIISAEKAALPILDLALNEKYKNTTGEYFKRFKTSEVSKEAMDQKAIDQLIAWSEMCIEKALNTNTH
jgi:short-subunit dehydrogenase